ncbi:MAG TPA: PQQ-binding-like beta-propeller repeat protein [Vicinamibacterales bacterium]|nr:PQQ-binding-like beta-propeller repeat protein [Vicinamibacterales bacterium]
MPNVSIRTVASAAAVLLLTASLVAQQGRPAAADTWGHWRGPAQTGVAPGAAPVRWSDASNIAWKIEIPGRGHSSPVVWGDRVFVTTAVPTGRKAEPPSASGGGRRGDGGAGAHEEHRFDVLALDRATGKIIWRQTAATAVPHEGYHAIYGSFASNSPTTDGQRLYVSFGSRGLFAYDLNGKMLWQRDFKIQMRMFQEFGEGVGPVLDEGRLIVLFDHEGDGVLAMLDAATGSEIWRTPRTDGTNWAAPLVVRHGGRKQIVVNSPRKVRAYDYETGKQIWETAGLGLNTIPRAVQHGDSVLVMSGFINPRLMAIRLGREGDLAGTDAIKWTATRALAYTTSPVLYEGKLYFLTDNGMASAIDADSGAPVYQQVRLPKPYAIKASPVVAGGMLYFPTEDGDVVVAKVGPTLDVVATNTLTDQSFVASPAVAAGDIFLRSRTHLFRIHE